MHNAGRGQIGNNKTLGKTGNKTPGGGDNTATNPRVRVTTRPWVGLATKPRVPHTPDFLWNSMDSVNLMRLSLKKGAHAILSNGSVQEIRGISLVFREMWDTTNLDRRLSTERTKNHG
jgi:hypothetical protein